MSHNQNLSDTSHSSIKTILLRLPNWLGDSVMASAAFEWLKIIYPQANFSIVGTKASCGIYERDPRIKHIYIDETKKSHCRFYATYTFAKKVGKHDIAISFNNSFFAALFLFWSKSPTRIGYAKNFRSFLLSNALPLHKSPLSSDSKHAPKYHQVILYIKLIIALQATQDFALAKLRLLRPDLAKQTSFTSDELAYALSTMPLKLIAKPLDSVCSHDKTDLSYSPKRIGINPGAAFGSAKRWEQSHFIAVIKHFLAQGNEVYLFGSSIESSANAQIVQSLELNKESAKYFKDLTNKTTLSELIDYIAMMNVFITNDSGPMHIATALKVPIVAIFGPTDIGETAPYRVGKYATLISKSLPCSPCKKRECPLKHHQCMKQITPEEVITQAQLLLDIFPTRTFSSRYTEEIQAEKIATLPPDESLIARHPSPNDFYNKGLKNAH